MNEHENFACGRNHGKSWWVTKAKATFIIRTYFRLFLCPQHCVLSILISNESRYASGPQKHSEAADLLTVHRLSENRQSFVVPKKKIWTRCVRHVNENCVLLSFLMKKRRQRTIYLKPQSFHLSCIQTNQQFAERSSFDIHSLILCTCSVTWRSLSSLFRWSRHCGASQN